MHASVLAGAVAFAFGATVVGTYLTRRYALTLGLVDAPNQRSSHTLPTPNGGGLGFALAGTLAAVMQTSPPTDLITVLLFSLMLAAVGLIDDVRHVAVRARFATQMLAIAGGLAALGAFQHGPWMGVVLLLGGIWWVNLFNFMDGIDGIAATQAIFMLLAGAAMAASQHPDIMQSAVWMWTIIIPAALAGFLLFNWPPASIFMGDVGSTWLGYVIFLIAVTFVREHFLSAPAWIILGAFFVADSTTTLFRRLLRRVRWFEAHRSHAYQRLARRLDSHLPVTLLGIAINFFWLAPWAWAAEARPEWGWACVAAAYIPLVAAAIAMGAGSSDTA